MPDQPFCHKRRIARRGTADIAFRYQRRFNLTFVQPISGYTRIDWPGSHSYKAHSSAFVLQGTPDYALITWLARIMIKLHKQQAQQRARWSGPCGRSRCRLNGR